jgi:hypothetical protein
MLEALSMETKPFNLSVYLRTPFFSYPHFLFAGIFQIDSQRYVQQVRTGDVSLWLQLTQINVLIPYISLDYNKFTLVRWCGLCV